MSIEELQNRQAKANLVSEYKEVILNNFQTVCYPLFTILNSEKKLEQCEGYEKILEFSNKNIVKQESYKDELYVLRTLASYLDRTPLMGDEKEKAKQKVLGYERYFNKKTKSAS